MRECERGVCVVEIVSGLKIHVSDVCEREGDRVRDRQTERDGE
jgi:hypothetical protein